MARILIVEDDESLAESVRRFLLFEQHSIEICHNGMQAYDKLRDTIYDVILLDWDLPGMAGIDILSKFRQNGGNTPVIMLTGHTTLKDKESGLDTGADDYLAKPFDMKELGARVRALLRRPAQMATKVVSCGSLELDTARHGVIRDGESISLVPKEYQMLEFFMRHPNQVFNADVLLNQIWSGDLDTTTDAVRTVLKRLRKKIDPDQKLIKTVHGVGYILEIPS